MLQRLIFVSLFALCSPASALTITNDTGCQIASYVDKIIRAKGGRIVINGVCSSACTLYLRGNACATGRAQLVFHAASTRAGTRLLMSTYPPRVRRWIRSQGGLGSRPIVA